jgi:hypothetical protein
MQPFQFYFKFDSGLVTTCIYLAKTDERIDELNWNRPYTEYETIFAKYIPVSQAIVGQGTRLDPVLPGDDNSPICPVHVDSFDLGCVLFCGTGRPEYLTDG